MKGDFLGTRRYATIVHGSYAVWHSMSGKVASRMWKDESENYVNVNVVSGMTSEMIPENHKWALGVYTWGFLPEYPGTRFNVKAVFPGSRMEIPIPVRQHLYIETTPCWQPWFAAGQSHDMARCNRMAMIGPGPFGGNVSYTSRLMSDVYNTHLPMVTMTVESSTCCLPFWNPAMQVTHIKTIETP